MEPKVIWILATIFLVFIFPFVLLGNLLGFIGSEAAPTEAANIHQIIFQIFLWVSLAYPVSYFTAMLLNKRAQKLGKTTQMIVVSFLPLVHIFVISILFFLTFATETLARSASG